jgi:hypothetical protein
LKKGEREKVLKKKKEKKAPRVSVNKIGNSIF